MVWHSRHMHKVDVIEVSRTPHRYVGGKLNAKKQSVRKQKSEHIYAQIIHRP